MRTEPTYKWRIKRTGQWTTTPHCTEEEIKAEHPDAIRLPGTLRERATEPVLIAPTGRKRTDAPLPPRDFMAECDPRDIPF